jgi:N utilization substance protein B
VSKRSKAKKHTKSKQVTQSTKNIRAARVLILQILYEIDLVGHDVADTLTYHLDEAELEYKFERFVRSMVIELLQNKVILDDYIQKLAPSWPLDQMAAVERNILRMGMYELLHHPETSQSIVIHEAIQLARYYGASSSRRFVNGVLGSFISKYLGKE